MRSPKGQEKDDTGYKSNDPSLGYSKVGHKIRDNIRNTQISPVSILPAPLIGPSDHSHLQDVHFYTRCVQATSTPGTQQAVLYLTEVSQWVLSRDMLYQPLHLESVDNRNYHISSNVHSYQVTPLSQQCYLSYSPRRNGRNRDRCPYNPPGNGGHYPHQSGGRCGGSHYAPHGGDSGPPDDPYGAVSDHSSSTEFGKRYD